MTDMVFSLKYKNKYSGPWHASIGMENVIFLILTNRKLQNQFTYTWQKKQSTYYFAHQLQLCDITYRDYEDFNIPQDIKLFHYNDILLIWYWRAGIGGKLDNFIKYIHSIRCKINSMSIQEGSFANKKKFESSSVDNVGKSPCL